DGSVSMDARRRLSGQALRVMEKDSFDRRQFLFEVGRALQQAARRRIAAAAAPGLASEVDNGTHTDSR
ncbi:hypothetical protein, partial [Chromobacterium piscinae]